MQRDTGINDVETGFSAYHASNYDSEKVGYLAISNHWSSTEHAQRDTGINDVETGFSAYHVSNYDVQKVGSL